MCKINFPSLCHVNINIIPFRWFSFRHGMVCGVVGFGGRMIEGSAGALFPFVSRPFSGPTFPLQKEIYYLSGNDGSLSLSVALCC